MSNEILLQTFFRDADSWICDGYYLDFRYIAKRAEVGFELWDASLTLAPLPPKPGLEFRIEAAGVGVGQIQQIVEDRTDLLKLLSEAAAGVVKLSGDIFNLAKGGELSFYSEMNSRERWFSDLHLQIADVARASPSAIELATVDSALRLSQPPFDGLADAAAWLGLRSPNSMSPAISIRVSPPVDVIIPSCRLSGDVLRLTLHAHPKFDVSRVDVSLRAVPGNALAGRRNIGNEFSWGAVDNDRREGTTEVQLENADSVLVMLMLGNSTVRRNWFLDLDKAGSSRLLATQCFDRDLRMVKQAVLESTDSLKFEKGVASLLFIVGFSAAIQVETDAPDLIVITPGGRLVIVECTIRTSDIAAKLGKLVDRRGALLKLLAAAGLPTRVASVLVCRSPREQIAVHAEALRGHNTVLIAGEDIAAAFDRVRFPNDPDKMLDEALAQLEAGKGMIE